MVQIAPAGNWRIWTRSAIGIATYPNANDEAAAAGYPLARLVRRIATVRNTKGASAAATAMPSSAAVVASSGVRLLDAKITNTKKSATKIYVASVSGWTPYGVTSFKNSAMASTVT